MAAIVFQVGLTQKAGDFVNSTNHTRQAVDDVTDSGLLRGVQILNLPGTLCLAFGLVLLALNAMRVGLLTRFMGVLGIICGAALVLLPQNPVVVFWLLALGVLFARRWPQGMPPGVGVRGSPCRGRRPPRSPSSGPRRAATRQAASQRRRNCPNPDPPPRIQPQRNANASADTRSRGTTYPTTHRNERGVGWRLRKSHPKRDSIATRPLAGPQPSA